MFIVNEYHLDTWLILVLDIELRVASRARNEGYQKVHKDITITEKGLLLVERAYWHFHI